MTKKKRKGRIIGKVFFVLGLILSISIGSMAATVVHKGDSMLGLINYDKDNSLSMMDLTKYKLDSDTEIVNILLVGADKNADEQNQKGAERRSDSMMIATMDIKHSKLKITSLMRDMYVNIPGHGGNKLNSAYFFGGIQLLYETIAENFGIQMDGYAEVNFDAFVNVIDKLGGIEVKLTESEAKHLNATNYIKRKKYRNVKDKRLPGSWVLPYPPREKTGGWALSWRIYCKRKRRRLRQDGAAAPDDAGGVKKDKDIVSDGAFGTCTGDTAQY